MDSLGELEALMERMKQIQEGRTEDEASQAERDTCLEEEQDEGLFVVAGDPLHSFPPSGMLLLPWHFPWQSLMALPGGTLGFPHQGGILGPPSLSTATLARLASGRRVLLQGRKVHSHSPFLKPRTPLCGCL